jgi:anti-anti-sigma regulatory factor
MTVQVQLHDRLDYQSVAPLISELSAINDAEVLIDASEIRHLGAQCLQVILSAVKTRSQAGQTTQIVNASDACIDTLELFGFTPETLTQPETWT